VHRLIYATIVSPFCLCPFDTTTQGRTCLQRGSDIHAGIWTLRRRARSWVCGKSMWILG